MITDLVTFCHQFFDATYIPATYVNYTTHESISVSSSNEIRDIIRTTLEGFLHFKKNPDYFVSDSFSYYGYVYSETLNSCIVIGPVFSTPVSPATVRAFMHEQAILPEHKEMVTDFLSNIPTLSFNQFLSYLMFIHFCLNDEKLSVAKHFKLDDTSSLKQVSSVHSEALVDLKENQIHHNTYNFERKLMQFIQNGETEKVKALLSATPQLSGGIIADNALRQEKNIFIALATQVSRSAILGGMDIEQAYQLSDIYIRESEQSLDIQQISNLSYTMLMDFTERVANNKIPGGMSQEIFDCVQFITRHVNEPIQVGDVADHVKRSRSYLTKKFKSELGFDISSFIMRCKLEEAKSLLTYSDKSLSEISNYLCFSTQAYFQNVFKKKYGMTPTKYRNSSRRVN